MTFKGFKDRKRLLDRSQFFDMLEGKKISAMFPKSWKKSYNNGIIIPAKMRRCDKYRSKILCATCNIQFNEIKEFEDNLNLSKREIPNKVGYMLPYFIEQNDLFVKNYLNGSSILKCYFEKIFYFSRILFNE